jgi:hypothetical protein
MGDMCWVSFCLLERKRIVWEMSTVNWAVFAQVG